MVFGPEAEKGMNNKDDVRCEARCVPMLFRSGNGRCDQAMRYWRASEKKIDGWIGRRGIG